MRISSTVFFSAQNDMQTCFWMELKVIRVSSGHNLCRFQSLMVSSQVFVDTHKKRKNRYRL